MASALSESAEYLLAPQLQAWIQEQGWSGLNEVQAQAIPIILSGDRDLIIVADTAGGKTESVYLPILTRLAADHIKGGGIQVVYISPLKALINDQFDRVAALGRCVGVNVCRWHGDAPVGPKRKLQESPDGVVLITPESLEARFVRHGPEMPRWFSALTFIVIDELHHFIGTERGRQLQSLLHRMELACGHRVPRIALSATIGGIPTAAEFLRPGGGTSVAIVAPPSPPRKVNLRLKGYESLPLHLDQHSAPAISPDDHSQADSPEKAGVAEDIHAVVRDSKNLIFPNSRANVEKYTERLRRISHDISTGGIFMPHHGSLSAEHRREVERRLKEGDDPINVVATTTLELGLDIGSIESIAQIGCPISVSSMRQRMGRSGRAHGKRPSMRIFITEPPIDENRLMPDCIRPSLFQAVAMTELMFQRWCEPPSPDGCHYSTLVQQVISLVAERGTIAQSEVRRILCEGGPFRLVDGDAFQRLISELTEKKILAGGANGLSLAERGLKMIRHYKFFAAFNTPVEYLLRYGNNEELGTVPISRAIAIDGKLLFGGRLWRVVSIDRKRRIVELDGDTEGEPPLFLGDGFHVDDRVRKEMLKLYQSDHVPVYLDETARRFLSEGREMFKQLELDRRAVLATRLGSALFPWAGDRIMNSIAANLLRAGALAFKTGCFISIAEIGPKDVVALLSRISRQGFDHLGVVETLFYKDRHEEKWDRYVPLDLCAEDYARRFFDPAGAQETVNGILAMERC